MPGMRDANRISRAFLLPREPIDQECKPKQCGTGGHLQEAIDGQGVLPGRRVVSHAEEQDLLAPGSDFSGARFDQRKPQFPSGVSDAEKISGDSSVRSQDEQRAHMTV